MRNILVICPYPVGVAAGQRLKYEQYFDNWNNNGYQVVVSPFMDERMWNVVHKKGNFLLKVVGTLKGYLNRIKDIRTLKEYDLVYIFMWVTPFGGTLFERIFRFFSKKIIFDIEDSVDTAVKSSINPMLSFFRGRRSKAHYLIKHSDHVISSSPFLNDYCLKLNKKRKSTYISSSINVQRFIPINKYKNDHKIVIGWTGTFTSIKYLNLLREVFIELAKCCEYKLLVIGNFKYHIPGVDVETVEWTFKNEVKDLQRIDIGIYPLDTGDWVLGKSGLKVIQYMSFGLPTISTDIGTTKKIVSHMENGILAKTDEEWLFFLKLLINDNVLRKNLGLSALKVALSRYSQEAIAPKYLTILNKE